MLQEKCGRERTAREASLWLVSNRARHRFIQQIEIFCWKLVLIPGQRLEYLLICADEPLCAPRCPEPQTASSADHAGVGLSKLLGPGLLREQQERLATASTQPSVVNSSRCVKSLADVPMEASNSSGSTLESSPFSESGGCKNRILEPANRLANPSRPELPSDLIPQSSYCENRRSSLAISLKRHRPLSPLVRPLPEAGL